MNGERFTLDTNILVYSVDTQAGLRCEIAKQIVDRASLCDCWLALQAISEFYSAATRKGRMPAPAAANLAQAWLDVFPCLPSSLTAVSTALAAAVSRKASYWDALLVATAAEGGCTAIVTEDLADGAIIGGLRVVNPFDVGGLSQPARELLGIPE